MSDAVIVSIVAGSFGFLGTIATLVLGARLNSKVNRNAHNVAAIRDQVVNDHTTNFREEGDERHSENSTKLDTILARQVEQGDEIKGLRKSVGRLFERTDAHTDQIHDLELTQPRGRFAPPARHRGD